MAEATVTRDDELRADAARELDDARRHALEACKAIDALEAGKIRLAIQGVVDAIDDARSELIDEEIVSGSRVTWFSTLLDEQRVGTVQTLSDSGDTAIVLPDESLTTILRPVRELKLVTL